MYHHGSHRCFLSARPQIDGKLVQSGHTRDLVFRVPRLIACVSAVMTLSPGDLILTGTPAGVGAVLPGQVLSAGMEAGGKLVGTHSCAYTLGCDALSKALTLCQSTCVMCPPCSNSASDDRAARREHVATVTTLCIHYATFTRPSSNRDAESPAPPHYNLLAGRRP